MQESLYIKNDKKKFLICIYIILMILSMFLRINIIQDLLLIISCFFINKFMMNKFEIEDNKFYIISNLIIIINIILIFVSYYNAVHLGFQDGLLYGQVGNGLYYDTYDYYYQSKTVSDLWMNGNMVSYLTGGINKNLVEVGIYNYFIVWNAILRVLFGNNLNALIIIKYQLSIISIILLYKISIQFLKPKYARMAVILMNMYPGYILVNIQLMRDNIILFFILAASYMMIMKKSKEQGKNKFWIMFIATICIITYLRIYIGIILGVSLLVYYLYDKMNFKRFILTIFLMILVVLVVGKITELRGYGFLASKILNNQEAIESIRWNSSKVDSPFKLVINSIFQILTGGRPNISNMNLSSFIEILNTISPLFISAFILPTILILVLKTKEYENKFILFSFFFSVISGTMIFYIFTGIIPRLYICWLWSQIIILGILIEKASKLRKELKLVGFVEYISYIALLILVFVK